MLIDAALLVGGLVVIMLAADRMVLAASDLAQHWGISPIVAGAVIIGFGSSMPEMLVSLLALDQPNGLDLAIGNIVGSNIVNLSLVLGVTVLLYPIAGQKPAIQREGTLMLGALVALTWFLWDGTLTAAEGLVLVIAMVGSGFLVVSWSRTLADDDGDQPERPEISPARKSLVALAGLAALIAGARAMVVGAEGLAIEFGIAEGVVGLTILALGTSLPELGATIAAARRRQADLVVGNVLGSNLFNAFAVAGGAGILGAGRTVTDFRPELAMMLIVALIAGAAARSGDRLHRLEGALLIASYPVAVLIAL